LGNAEIVSRFAELISKTFTHCPPLYGIVMAIGSQQAAIRALIATALSEHVSESGQSVDALVAMRQAEAIVRALELAGYEIKRKT
jgi:hypothetical protein